MWKDYFRQRIRKRRPLYPSGSRARLIAKIAKISFIVVVIGIVLLLVSIPLIARDLPSPDKVVRHSGFSTKILDRNGQVLYDVYSDQNRIPVNFQDIPLYLREGTISIEDKNFYKNNGFDITGVLRGLLSTFFRGQLAGGSTL